MKNIKKILLFILCFFLFYIFVLFFCEKTNNVDVEEIIDTHIFNNNLIYNVKVDDITCPYDQSSNIYYYSTSDFSQDISFGSYRDVEYTFYSVDDNIYRFLVYDSDYYTIVTILIDSVPIVNIYDMNIFSNNVLDVKDSSIGFALDNNVSDYVGVQIINLQQGNGSNYFVSLGDLSIRGASSTFFQKKSYKLKLEHDLSIMNLGKDNIFVLDALYSDPSKIRNKLSSDLWNLINDNQKINNDLNAQYVEVFINNEYRGLYVLKEKVDRSVTNINGSGLLLKAVGHLDSAMISRLLSDEYSAYDDKIMNFEIKDFNYYSINLFLKKIKNFYMNNKNYDSIINAFDLDNYINYKIFVSLLCGEDNVTSNQYYSMMDYNSNILITPWDMDLTWGSFWNLNRHTLSEFIWDKDFDYEWLDDSIYGIKDEKLMSLFKKRYWELRKDVITMNMINNYLNSYRNELVSSGAAKRDGDRWYPYDIEYEIEQIREWANHRIQFLDEYFK